MQLGVHFVNPGTQRIPRGVAQRLDGSGDVATVFEIVLDSYYRPGQVIPGSRAAAQALKGEWITE